MCALRYVGSSSFIFCAHQMKFIGRSEEHESQVQLPLCSLAMTAWVHSRGMKTRGLKATVPGEPPLPALNALGLGQQQVGGEGCAAVPAHTECCLHTVPGLGKAFKASSSLCAHATARDEQSTHYCVTQYSTKEEKKKKKKANLVLRQGKIKLFLFF